MSEGVIVAFDGSVQASRALHAFLASGLAARGPIRIVTVHPVLAAEAAKTADRAVEYLRFHGIEAERVPMVGGSASPRFLDYAEQSNAELLVMGAYGQSSVSEFFFGSATCEALRRSKVPVFFYH